MPSSPVERVRRGSLFVGWVKQQNWGFWHYRWPAQVSGPGRSSFRSGKMDRREGHLVRRSGFWQSWLGPFRPSPARE
jgi:hypothetical protein